MSLNTAKERYDELDLLREPYLRRARACSKFTIPSLIPPLGWNGSMDLPEPWNNLGARGVNHLSSKLLLTLFPPGSPCFRNELDPATRLKIENDPALGGDPAKIAATLAHIDDAMADIEKRFGTYTEMNQHRVSLGEVFKHLIVGGNALLYMPDKPGLRVFRLDKFVVLRDSSGKVLEIVVKECVSKKSLPEETRALLKEEVSSSDESKEAKAAEKTIDLYTHVYWDQRTYRIYQQLQNQVVPGSQGNYPADKLPWLPLRWTKIDGEDYGWGHVDTMLGDLSTLDMLTQAITEGSAAAARVFYLKAPGKVGPNTKDFAKTPNGGIIVADHDAIIALQLQKQADFQIALQRVNDLEKSLSFSFLLNTAIQRQGERVTAEEIRYMAQELEDALGGVYSVLSQELQLPYVTRNLFVMAKKRMIPALPNDIKPVIITGIEALGRGNDLSRLDTWLQGVAQALGPEVLATAINPDEYMRRRAVALSVDTKGLIKTPAEIAQAQQAQQMQQMIQRLGPNVVNQVGSNVKSHIDNQSKENVANAKAAGQQQPAAGNG